jgi:transcriptional regulator with XRE-family HTH domain
VTANAIDKLEAGQNWPTVKTLLEIARVLECSVDLLLGHDRVIYTLLPAEAEALAILRRLPPDRVPLALSVLAGLEKT